MWEAYYRRIQTPEGQDGALDASPTGIQQFLARKNTHWLYGRQYNITMFGKLLQPEANFTQNA